MSAISQEELIQDCMERYTPSTSNTQATCFGRFINFAEAIGLEGMVQDELDILDIGPGLVWGENYEIPEIIAYLHHHGKTIQTLRIVDRSPEVLEAIKQQIGLCVHLHANKRFGLFEEHFIEMWDRYVEMTPDVNQDNNSCNMGEIFTAQLPSTYDKIARMDFQCADIATYTDKQQYDLIVCRHVLYQLDESGQELAISNISKLMRPGALLLIGKPADYDIDLESENREWKKRYGLEYADGLIREGAKMVIRKVSV